MLHGSGVIAVVVAKCMYTMYSFLYRNLKWLTTPVLNTYEAIFSQRSGNKCHVQINKSEKLLYPLAQPVCFAGRGAIRSVHLSSMCAQAEHNVCAVPRNGRANRDSSATQTGWIGGMKYSSDVDFDVFEWWPLLSNAIFEIYTANASEI